MIVLAVAIPICDCSFAEGGGRREPELTVRPDKDASVSLIYIFSGQMFRIASCDCEFRMRHHTRGCKNIRLKFVPVFSVPLANSKIMVG